MEIQAISKTTIKEEGTIIMASNSQKMNFRGAGDNTIMDYRSLMDNTINSTQFNEFSSDDYQPPDLAEKKALKATLEARDTRSQVWAQSPAGIAYQELQTAAPPVDPAVLAAAAPPADSKPLTTSEEKWLEKRFAFLFP